MVLSRTLVWKVLCGTRNGALKIHFLKVQWDTFIGSLKNSLRKWLFKEPWLWKDLRGTESGSSTASLQRTIFRFQMAPLIVLCVDQSLEVSPPSHLRKSWSPAANRMSSSSWRLAAVASCTAAVCRATLSARRSSLLIPPRGSTALVRSAAPPWLHFPGEKATGGRTGVVVHEDIHRGTRACRAL